MNVTKLLQVAARFDDVPDIIGAAGAAALDIAVLIDRIRENHDRARAVLKDGELAELNAIHAETLALIDTFDDELAEAAAR